MLLSQVLGGAGACLLCRQDRMRGPAGGLQPGGVLLDLLHLVLYVRGPSRLAVHAEVAVAGGRVGLTVQAAFTQGPLAQPYDPETYWACSLPACPRPTCQQVGRSSGLRNQGVRPGERVRPRSLTGEECLGPGIRSVLSTAFILRNGL